MSRMCSTRATYKNRDKPVHHLASLALAHHSPSSSTSSPSHHIISQHIREQHASQAIHSESYRKNNCQASQWYHSISEHQRTTHKQYKKNLKQSLLRQVVRITAVLQVSKPHSLWSRLAAPGSPHLRGLDQRTDFYLRICLPRPHPPRLDCPLRSPS